ncbi:MAG: asparagine synthase (glutamine-hydrolyzing) [Elusimicrobiota bacterium]
MCGIAGKIAWTSGSTVNEPLLRTMSDALRHRGPDEGGAWVQGAVGLAMRRLKIIDLAGGQQPMANGHCPLAAKSGPLRLVYNGEIYGFRGFRRELEEKGHRFQSSSDTEVILHAFEEHGEGFLERLNGMFGLALYAERDRVLYLARDRMGIKPVYYRAAASSFSFASEIKALLADPETSREWDRAALNEYFSLRYVPTPRSAYKEIRKLEPGHFLKVRDGRVENRRYWNFSPPAPDGKPLGHYLERLDALLKRSVESHLVSDVPLGVFLSGGLDSTTVASYVHAAGASLDSFTVYFSRKSFSERHEAALVAQRYGLRHHELNLQPDLPEAADDLAGVFDEPFADASGIPTYYLCRFARRTVTVALSGDGGDELFAGYPTYIANQVSTFYRVFPGLVQKTLRRLGRMLPVSYERISFDYKVKAFLAAAGRPQPYAHFGWQEMFSRDEKRDLYSPEFIPEIDDSPAEESFVRAYTEAEARTRLERMLFLDQRTHLLDEYLVKMDRLSMAHSLEVRVPLLDNALVEFAAEIPAAYKLRGLTTKYILRRLMRDRLPPEILAGPKKGFTPPLATWLATDFRAWADDVLSPENVRKTGLINPDAPRALLKEHVERRRDNHRRLWTLICFMSWFRRYGE